jgi:aspartyl-tRNA(Asn)/glutamyl-tRNA(Gln) amidotransferase subunit C
MKVTEKEVSHVADLANLELTEQERTRLAKDLNSILEYIDRLNELDTSNVPPMAQVTGGASDNAMRADELRPSLAQEAALQNAPDASDGFFKVPKVIEK